MGGDFSDIKYRWVGIFNLGYINGWGFLSYDILMGGDF
jgi:hypothetical protein